MMLLVSFASTRQPTTSSTGLVGQQAGPSPTRTCSTDGRGSMMVPSIMASASELEKVTPLDVGAGVGGWLWRRYLAVATYA